jgi:diguanylate cyclase (GGDEF)-like protein
VAQASRELARIQHKIEEARSALSRLNGELHTARTQLSESHADGLLEANEQLVFATLHAQRAAEISQHAMRDAVAAAEVDSLTGLPNRVMLRTRLALAVAEAKDRGGRVALLFLGIINFKDVNDSLGNAVGDKVLQHAALCLTTAVRAETTVSRQGSDEFVILLPDVLEASEAVTVAQRIVTALGVPLRFDNHVLRLSANVGISIYPEDGECADDLIDRAVAAMYRAKWRGVDSYAFEGETPGSKRSLELRKFESLRNSVTQLASARAEHAKHQVLLQEANTELVMAALSAQQLLGAADQARRQQSDFMGVLAHELRNPLTVLHNATALMGRFNNREPLMTKVEAIIERQVNSISRLVGDLLDVSRVSTGKLSIEKFPVDMIRLIDEVVGCCRPAIDTRLQQLDVQLPGYRIEINGDQVRLTQILTNLLDNASKYTPEGGVVRLSVEAEGNELVMKVSDNGIGISAETLPHIFEPFIQDAHAMVFDRAGLGIGLTVVRELVDAHGGRINASSDGKSRGSCFTVRLPLLNGGGSLPAALLRP